MQSFSDLIPLLRDKQVHFFVSDGVIDATIFIAVWIIKLDYALLLEWLVDPLPNRLV